MMLMMITMISMMMLVMMMVQVSPWNNHWWNIHDFSPVEGGSNWARLGQMFKVFIFVQFSFLFVSYLFLIYIFLNRFKTFFPCLKIPPCEGSMCPQSNQRASYPSLSAPPGK